MILLSRPRRTPRAHEWSAERIVTFIVTLAATRCVTLAAREAGMSRKSAYALKARDSGFAAAWTSALGAHAKHRQGDEAHEARTARNSPDDGDRGGRTAPSTSSTRRDRSDREIDELARDLFFARLAAGPRSAPAAGGLPRRREPLSMARLSRSKEWPA